MGKSGQFANHPVDASAQQPPSIAVGQDGNTRVGAQPLGLGSLFFDVHLIFLGLPENWQSPARVPRSDDEHRSEKTGSRCNATARKGA